MNKDNNQRFQATEEKILTAYGVLAARKDFDKITVSAICREAKIHRTTFYGHFLDMYHLRECASKNQFQRLIESIGQKDGTDYREMILQELHFYYRHRKIVRKHFLSENIDSISLFPTMLDNTAIFSENSPSVGRTGNARQIQKEREYFETFLQAGFIAILRKWILADCPESPEELTEIICKINL